MVRPGELRARRNQQCAGIAWGWIAATGPINVASEARCAVLGLVTLLIDSAGRSSGDQGRKAAGSLLTLGQS